MNRRNKTLCEVLREGKMRMKKAGKDTQEGCLATSGRSQKGKEFSSLYEKTDIVKNAIVSEAFRYMVDLDYLVCILHRGQIKGWLFFKPAEQVFAGPGEVEFPG